MGKKKLTCKVTVKAKKDAADTSESTTTGDALAQEAFSLYQQGDMQGALEKAKQSIDAGSLLAEELVCEYYYNAEPDSTEAFTWYEKCAKLGSARGYRMMGIAYLNAQAGVAQDYGKALENLKNAYELGDMKAPRYLGQIYRDGLGVEKNLTEAAGYYKAAADTGDITGTYELAKIDIYEIKTEASYSEAFSYLKAAADNNANTGNDRIIPVVVELAKLYESGKGVPENEKATGSVAAMTYYELAYSFDEETATGKDADEKDAYNEAKAYVESNPMVETELAGVIKETVQQFKVEAFTDTNSGITINYNIYLPKNYDAEKKYPAVLFIHDSGSSSTNPRNTLLQGYGATIWATAEQQAKEETIVIAPQFDKQIVNDDFSKTAEVDAIVPMLQSIEAAYSIDPNRVYITGQSMGCMTAMELNIQYPDLFAGSLYVAGQWDISKMKPLEADRICYIVSAGDAKASKGQSNLKALLDSDQVSYAEITMKGTAVSGWETYNATQASTLFAKNQKINLIQLENGTVFTEQIGALYQQFGMDEATTYHLSTWGSAYRIDSVREWLLTQ